MPTELGSPEHLHYGISAGSQVNPNGTRTYSHGTSMCYQKLSLDKIPVTHEKKESSSDD